MLLFEDSDIRKANFPVRIPDRVSSALASRGAEDALDAWIG
ncbi:hypothetical protein [Duganella aceris]|nr:hypothetical protein [Duganella aceris]